MFLFDLDPNHTPIKQPAQDKSAINKQYSLLANIDLILNLTLLNVNYILIISLFFLLNNNPLVFVLRFRTFALGANVKYSVFSSLFCYLVFNYKTIECNVK
jgi:hypothetical protein